MTKYEKYLLENFHELYLEKGAIEGLTWDDCCDYDENDNPTWFLFTDGMFSIDGFYDEGLYVFTMGYKGWSIKKREFKTLRGAIKYYKKMKDYFED